MELINNMYTPDVANHNNLRVRPQFANIELDPAWAAPSQNVIDQRFRVIEHLINFSVNPPVESIRVVGSGLKLDQATSLYRQHFSYKGDQDAL